MDFEKDNFWASFWNGRNVCADPFVGGHILCRITVEKIRMNKLENMETHLFHSYLGWKGNTRNRIWLWLHFVPWYVFDFRFCVRIKQCLFDLILWNCFALFCLKKIEKKNYSKTSNQNFVFFFIGLSSPAGPAESRYYESNEHEHPQKTSVGVIQIFDAIKQNFFIYPHTHIDREWKKNEYASCSPLFTLAY